MRLNPNFSQVQIIMPQHGILRRLGGSRRRQPRRDPLKYARPVPGAVSMARRLADYIGPPIKRSADGWSGLRPGFRRLRAANRVLTPPPHVGRPRSSATALGDLRRAQPKLHWPGLEGRGPFRHAADLDHYTRRFDAAPVWMKLNHLPGLQRRQPLAAESLLHRAPRRARPPPPARACCRGRWKVPDDAPTRFCRAAAASVLSPRPPRFSAVAHEQARLLGADRRIATAERDHAPRRRAKCLPSP